MLTEHRTPHLTWRERLSCSRSFQVTVGSSRARLVAHFRERTAPPAPGTGEASGSSFVGTVGEEGFRIIGFRDYRSSFLPSIKGRFEGGAAGATIHLSMRPHREVLIFLSIWYLFLLLCSLLILYSSFGTGPFRLLLLVVPLGLGAATWILSALVFESDALWALRILKEALPGGRDGTAAEEENRTNGAHR